MSRLPIAVGLLLAVARAAVQDEEGWHREYHPDGSLRLEVEVEPGWNGAVVRDGKLRVLAPDGVVRIEGRYKDGRPRGKWTFRYADGTDRAQGYFDDGVPAREWKIWRPDGALWARGEVAGAVADAAWTPPFPPGVWEVRDAGGAVDPVHSGRYEVVELRWPSGSLRDAGLLLDGAPHGPWVGLWEDGSPRESGAFVRGERVGPWAFRHRDGAVDDALIRAEGDAPEWPSVPSIEDEAGGRDGVARAEDGDDASAGEGADAGDASAAGPTPANGAANGAAQAEPATAGAPAAPGALPLLAPASPDPAISALLAGLVSGNAAERGDAIRAAGRRGPEIVPACIDALAATDLASPEQAGRARALADALAVVCGGRSFGWRAATDDAAVAANRAAVRAWHSLWSLTAEDAVLWRIAFGSPATAGEALDFGRATRPHVSGAARAAAERRDDAPEVRIGLESALAWLAAHQSADGHWSAAGFGAHCRIRGAEACSGEGQDGHDVGITALATLAFLRAGNGPTGGPHADAVARALGWLLRSQQESGIYGARQRMEHIYGHCAATWVLSEAAADHDLAARAPAVLDSIRRAAQVIEAARNTGETLGWRYDFQPLGDADTSVTGWAFHALCAARRAGVEVSDAALAETVAFVDRMTGPDGRVGYDSKGSLSARTPEALETFPHALCGEPMTAIGVLIRLEAAHALGAPADAAALGKHAKLLAKMPSWEPLGGRDFYWWFWGAQAARALGGDTWQKWRTALIREVLHHQEPLGEARGSWVPESAWGAVGGRVYTTALLALCLAEAGRS